jgi:hypothetical protein
MSDRTIDDINRDLSEVLDGLLALPSDAFTERYVLQERQRALREEAATFAEDHDTKRPTAELQKELAALRTNLDALVGERINLALQAGGGGSGGGQGGSYGGRDGILINAAMDEAQGANRVRARIGRLEGILLDRGEPIE